MLKKLTLLAMSVAALLAIVAPAAQASGPLITNAAGEAAKTITATSTNTITHTAIGTLECTTVNLHGNISSNTGTTAQGSGTGEATGTPAGVGHNEKHTGHCASSGGPIVEVTSVTVADIHLTKHGAETTGTATFSFTYDLRNSTGAALIAECTFGTPEEKVTVKKTGTSTINILGNIKRTAGSAFCPSTGTITGDFTVSADGLGAATIH